LSTPNEQSDFIDTLSSLIAMIPFFMMTKFVLTPTQTKSPSEFKLVARSTPVKPTSITTRIQEQPESFFKPDLTPGLRGRAMGWPRPGWVIKEVLMKERTLYTSAYVSEASIIDLYKTYLCLINEENRLRDKYHKLKGPTLHSFDTYFRFAEYLGLVEKAGYEQTKSGMRRTAYRITQRGIDDDTSWDNLCGAWKEVRNKVVFKLPRSVVRGEA
jgi:hypothetical protein